VAHIEPLAREDLAVFQGLGGAVCSFFGYLNRWNDTMATTLEDDPRHFGEPVIASNGWNGDRHA
jgi:hypothetical protein